MKKMRNKNKKIFFFILVLLAANAFGFSVWANSARADSAPHIIINEIQTAGANSNDEFIELFNPTNAPIDLEGYKLSKKTKTGNSESTLISATKFSGIIQAHGYFLIAHPNYKDEISADLSYSSSTYYISNDNTVFLYDKEGILLDKVGFGAVAYSNSESSPALNPDANQSIERKDFIDTGNNAVDFSINISPSPKNSSITEGNDEESLSDAENIDDDSQDAPGACATESSNVRLNEIFPYPESGNEFVEIANAGKDCADVSGWKVMDEAGHEKSFPENSVLYPGEYLSLEGNLYLNNDSDTIYLLGVNGTAKSDALDRGFYEKAQKGFSYSFDGKSWQWTPSPTLKKENIITTAGSEESVGGADSKENYSAAEKVYLNEILPNPKGGSDDEYIEIASGESGPVDLFGWRLKDGSKSKGYQFKEHIVLNSGEYFAIYRFDSKITLNNSDESVNLYNPQGEVVSSAVFDKSQKNASFNFDGENWRWSKYLTPGKKNKFDSEPSVKIKKPKSVFKDIFAEFSAKAKDKETKKLKYAWDFGDGKKSYLAKTSHKYLDTGKYIVTLSVTDDSQTIEKSFTLNVKKYPRPDLEIVRIIPNPIGNDSDGEIVEIKNNSGKEIDLRGWKIATGSGEKIYNHPISDEITLSSDETKIITREVSKFTLNNKSGKVQLVSLDGKIIDEVIYAKEKISEGEVYVKMSDEWKWIAPNTPAETDDLEGTGDSEDTQSEESDEQPDGEILGAADENVSYFAPTQPRYTPEDEFIFYKAFGLLDFESQEMNFCPIKELRTSLAYL